MKNIAEHILDIVQNSIRAQATQISIELSESLINNNYKLVISDNGLGMDAETCKKVSDPFYTSRTTRKVGLGIPLLKQNAEQSGGGFSLKSEPGKGTEIGATFVLNHIDRLPVGDIVGTYLLLFAANPAIEFTVTHKTDSGNLTFDTREAKQMLGDIPLSTSEVRKFLKEWFVANMQAINASF
ncbi:MAG: sensor histidine kinase [Salinivirgaceae bacterium]